MRTLSIFLALGCFLAVEAQAQHGAVYLGSRKQPAQISLMGTFQRYVDEEQSISEMSIPLSIYVPAGRRVAFNLLAGGASANGEGLTTVSGLTDAIASIQYIQEFGQASLVASLTANIPSGAALSLEEFETSILLGQSFYDFRMPVFGQGFNLTPSVTAAVPFSETLVAGIGLAYQLRGEFDPAVEFDETYAPGNEVLITTGLDFRLSRIVVLSSDLTVALYGTDRIADEEVYRSGRSLGLSGQLRVYPGRDEMRLFVRYRMRAGGQLMLDGIPVPVAEQAVPNFLDARWNYRSPVNNFVSMGVMTNLRHFTGSEQTRALTLVDVGLLPTLAIMPQVFLNGRFAYTIGSFSGFEVGAGIGVSF